jgi:phosphotriesterase-related protein
VKIIRTVLGDIAPEELGLTSPHEHLHCDQRTCCDPVDFPPTQPRMVMQDAAGAVAELAHFRAAGGRALAEVTVHGWGRDVAVLQEIARRAGVHVIATSGFYVEECHPDFAAEADADALADFLVGELTEGADGTPIRTGLLKSAVSRPVIEGPEEKCARAVARAHQRTGVAITTHFSSAYRFEVAGGNVGHLHLDLFEAEGVDPNRVIIGHADSNTDVRQLAALAARGAYVEFDLIHRTHRLRNETRVALLRQLVERGHAERLLLASDVCYTTDWKIEGGNGYDHLLRDFAPRLRRAGFDDALLHQIMMENPARILSFETSDHEKEPKR